MLILFVQITIKSVDKEAKNNSEFKNSDGKVCFNIVFKLIYDTTRFNKFIIFPTVEPIIVYFNWTFSFPVAERNFSFQPIIHHFKGIIRLPPFFLIFVDFENEGGSVPWILQNACVWVSVFRFSLFIVFVNAVDICEVHSRQEVSDSCIVSAVKGPLHSRRILGDSFEMVVRLVEVSRRSCRELRLLVVKFHIHIEHEHYV